MFVTLGPIHDAAVHVGLTPPLRACRAARGGGQKRVEVDAPHERTNILAFDGGTNLRRGSGGSSGVLSQPRTFLEFDATRWLWSTRLCGKHARIIVPIALRESPRSACLPARALHPPSPSGRA